jgi:hypothetical protein
MAQHIHTLPLEPIQQEAHVAAPLPSPPRPSEFTFAVLNQIHNEPQVSPATHLERMTRMRTRIPNCPYTDTVHEGITFLGRQACERPPTVDDCEEVYFIFLDLTLYICTNTNTRI